MTNFRVNLLVFSDCKLRFFFFFSITSRRFTIKIMLERYGYHRVLREKIKTELYSKIKSRRKLVVCLLDVIFLVVFDSNFRLEKCFKKKKKIRF